MKLLRSAGVIALAAFAFAACDDDGTSPEISDFAGFWNATQFEYTDTSGRTPAPSIDAISLGGSVTLDVSDDGSFTGSVVIPTLTPVTGVPVSGDIAIQGDDQLSITFDEQTLAVVCATPETCLFSSFDATYDLDGDVLTFVNDDTTLDFPDAVEQQFGLDPAGSVDARLEVTLER